MNYAEWVRTQIHLHPNKIGPGRLLSSFSAEHGEMSGSTLDRLSEAVSSMIDAGEIVARWSEDGQEYDDAGLTYYPTDYVPPTSPNRILYERCGRPEELVVEPNAIVERTLPAVDDEAQLVGGGSIRKAQERIGSVIMDLLKSYPEGARLNEIQAGLEKTELVAIRLYPAKTYHALQILRKLGLVEKQSPKGKPIYRLAGSPEVPNLDVSLQAKAQAQ